MGIGYELETLFRNVVWVPLEVVVLPAGAQFQLRRTVASPITRCGFGYRASIEVGGRQVRRLTGRMRTWSCGRCGRWK